ncbi:hypothetical protein [Acinetobacter defluvii]|uniref:hypothetical protein n=1 Tax=Acinetobacter defluvii TaxID=1871111 RepID=UPI0014908A25|nr:hypothetical protein [Acinetobacter defluvii]
MHNKLDEETLYDIKKLLHKINYLAKCTVDSTVQPIEIEKIFEGLSDEARVILQQLNS